MRARSATRAAQRRRGRAGTPHTQRGVPRETSRPSIVLVGDPDRTERIAATLETLQVRSLVARSAEEAMAATERFTLGLMLAPPLEDEGPTTRILHRLRENPRVQGLPIFVIVPDHSGTREVRRLYAEGATAVLEWPREALLLPRIVLEMLHVPPPPRGGRPIDRALARAARARLRLIEGVGPDLRVSAREGVLHLKGRVPSLQVRRAVVGLAEHVPGAQGVSDAELQVRPSGRTDRSIAARVRGLLDDIVEGDTLSISVNDGHVVLMGTVESRAAFEQVVSLLSSVSGVRAITDLTRQSGEGRRRDHRVASTLQRSIELAHPRAGVRVAVLGDVAVLTGRVADVATRSAIRRRARIESEIERVVDKMEVAVDAPSLQATSARSA